MTGIISSTAHVPETCPECGEDPQMWYTQDVRVLRERDLSDDVCVVSGREIPTFGPLTSVVYVHG